MESSYTPYRYLMIPIVDALAETSIAIRKLIFQTHFSGAMLVQTRYLQNLLIVIAANMITLHLWLPRSCKVLETNGVSSFRRKTAPWSPG